MADFTLNGPGNTQNPWVPGSIAEPLGSLRSDSTGWRPTGFVYTVCAHNATYGFTITSTGTVAVSHAADEIYLGAICRSGTNAGCHIGCRWDLNGSAVFQFTTAAGPGGGATNISSGSATVTVNNGDVLSCTYAYDGILTATISASINGTPVVPPGPVTVTTTTCAWVNDPTLAAGFVMDPENTNATKMSQFTGTGVASGPPPVFVPNTPSGAIIFMGSYSY